jgi:hypothetical protein
MGSSGQPSALSKGSLSGGLERYRVIAAFVLTAAYVAIKAFGHDYWSVGFGLALLGIIVLAPQAPDSTEPWRMHALRIVSACFVVVTLGSIWTTVAP